MSNQFISVQQQDFDIKHEIDQLRLAADNAGAIVTFTGLVREFQQNPEAELKLNSAGQGTQVKEQRTKQHENPSQSQELFLEHYPGMTEKSLQAIVNEALERWEILACRVIHRVGPLSPGDQIVYVATASAHRQAAFEAAEFIMDYLKTRAPFWKRQTGAGGSQWVEHRNSDELAVKRWKK